MNYPFECPSCGTKETVSMPISQYQPKWHYCKNCGVEMVREVNSLVCGVSIDTTGDFYRKIN